MTTNAKIGHGVLLKIEDDNSPQNMVTVGEINSVSGPSISRDAVDATHSESPEKYREFIPGLKDGGDVTCELNMVPGSAGTTLLLSQLDKDVPSACQILLPTTPAYAWTFEAILTGFEPDHPVEDKMTASVTLKITGKPTLALAA